MNHINFMNYLESFELEDSLKLINDCLSNYYNFHIDYADNHICAVSKKDFKEYKIFDIRNYYIDNRKNIPDHIVVENNKVKLFIGR
jgi:hypothetical protein